MKDPTMNLGAAMETPADPRDEIWNAVFDTYYVTYFEEIVHDHLVRRWMRIDDATSVMVALTASSSAISGFALWSEPSGKLVWGILGGVAAALSVIHKGLSVPRRLTDLTEAKSSFMSLRLELETLRYRMEINPEFAVANFTDALVQHRKQLSEIALRAKDDILRTNNTLEDCQSELDRRLSDLISQGDEE